MNIFIKLHLLTCVVIAPLNERFSDYNQQHKHRDTPVCIERETLGTDEHNCYGIKPMFT